MHNFAYLKLIEDLTEFYQDSIGSDGFHDPSNDQTKYSAALRKGKKANLIALLETLDSIKDETQVLSREAITSITNTDLFSKEEIDLFKVNKKEKFTISAQMAHVIMTSTLGFGSAILGFLTLSNPVIAIALGILFLAGAFGSTHLVKTSLALIKKTEKQAFEQAILLKLTLELQIILNEKYQKKINKKLEKLNEKIKTLIGAGTEFELTKDNISGTALSKLTHLISTKYNIGPNDEIQILLDKIKHIKQDGAAFLSPQKSSTNIFLRFMQKKDSEDKMNLTPGSGLEPSFIRTTFRNWFHKNWSSAEQTGISNSCGTIAGSMVFPGFLIALATTNVAAIKVIGLSSVVLAMTSPIGLGITIGIVLLAGLTVAGLSLYSKYRNEKRNTALKNFEKSIRTEKERTHKYCSDIMNIMKLVEIVDTIDETLHSRTHYNSSNIIPMSAPVKNPNRFFPAPLTDVSTGVSPDEKPGLASPSEQQQSSFNLRNSQ